MSTSRMSCRLLQLPEELMRHILWHLPPRELVAAVPLCSRLKRTATQLLYRDISLHDCRAAVTCCNTLLSLEDDILHAVRSFKLQAGLLEPKDDQVLWMIKSQLPGCVRRMCRLESFSCIALNVIDQALCLAIMKIQTLRILEIQLPLEVDKSSCQATGKSDWPSPSLNASKIQIFRVLETAGNPGMDGIMDAFPNFFLRYILLGKDLKDLLIMCSRQSFPAFLRLFPLQGTLDSITTVSIPCISYDTSAVLRRMPNLRSLTIHLRPSSEDELNMGETPLRLDNLCCASELLPLLTPVCHELRCVQLDGPSQSSQSLCDYLFSWGAFCSQFAQTLKSLTTSSDTLRHLSVTLGTPQDLILTKDTPLLPALETVVVRFRQSNPTAAQLPRLPLKLFPRAPNLRTLRFAIDVALPWEDDVALQNDIIDKWEKEGPMLRTVGFSSKYLWTKSGHVWVREEDSNLICRAT